MTLRQDARQPSAALFSERLRMQLARHQMSQEQLAARLGVSQPAVSYWTRGKRIPSIEVLGLLADAFDVSTDYLLGRDPNGQEAA